MSDTPVRKSCLSLCEDLGASSLPDGPRGSNSQCHGCVYSMIYFVFNNNFSCLPARPTNILSMSASRDKLFLCHLLLKYLKKCPHTLRRQNCSVSRRLRERISGEVVKGGVGEVSLGRIPKQDEDAIGPVEKQELTDPLTQGSVYLTSPTNCDPWPLWPTLIILPFCTEDILRPSVPFFF